MISDYKGTFDFRFFTARGTILTIDLSYNHKNESNSGTKCTLSFDWGRNSNCNLCNVNRLNTFCLIFHRTWLFPISLEANRITFWKHCWCCFSDFSLFSFVCDISNHHINYFLYFPRNRLRWVLIDNPTQLTVIHDKSQKKTKQCYIGTFSSFSSCVCVCVSEGVSVWVCLWVCVRVSVYVCVFTLVFLCMIVSMSLGVGEAISRLIQEDLRNGICQRINFTILRKACNLPWVRGCTSFYEEHNEY